MSSDVAHSGFYTSIGSGETTIPAEDGFQLAATQFEAPGAIAGAPVTIIGPAVAVPRRFYAKFAAYLADAGRPTLTFDYRGIGGSRPASLKGLAVRMRDWCILDVPGVLAWTRRAHPDRPIHWIGHSMGGFATGLAHNNRLIARQLNIATLSGYWRGMAVPERYRVFVLMRWFAPLVVGALGYFPGRLMGGEDMPGPAFLEWRRWCLTPSFLFVDDTLSERANVARFTAPIRFAQIEDDIWGTPEAVRSIASHFTANAEHTIWPVRLADVKAKHIGHFGFFREQFRDTLWPAALAWLDGRQ